MDPLFLYTSQSLQGDQGASHLSTSFPGIVQLLRDFLIKLLCSFQIVLFILPPDRGKFLLNSRQFPLQLCHSLAGPAEHHGEVLDILDGDLVLLVDHAAPDVLHVHLQIFQLLQQL